jgi:hypothetical protein
MRWPTARASSNARTALHDSASTVEDFPIAEAGTLITLPGTGPNDLTLTQQADWKKWARAMSDAGLAAF